MDSLGQKIRQRRLEKGLTQGQLAEGLVSASAISQIESDKINPSYKLLCQLADRLEVSLDSFLADETEYLEHSTSHKLAQTFISAKEYANAVPILEKLLAADDEPDLEVCKDLATCYLQLKNHQAANELLEKVMNEALKENHSLDYLWALKQLGLLYYNQNNISLAHHYWKKAHEFIQQTIVQDDDLDPFLHAEVTTNLAITYNHLGNYEIATELFQKSQNLLKNSSNLYHLAVNHFGLGKSYYEQKDYKTAEKHCQEAISIFKNLEHIRYSIEVKENYAILRGEHGHYQEALDLLNECLQEYKDNHFTEKLANTHAEIAKALINLGRLDEADRHLEQAFLQCEPQSFSQAECHFVRSLMELVRNRYDTAILEAKLALNLYLQLERIQEYNKVSLHLSDIYKKLGDYKSSTEQLENSQQVLQHFLRERGLFL